MPQHADAESENHEPLSGMRALVIEARPDLRAAVCGALTAVGARVGAAADEAQAVELFRAEGPPCELVLVAMTPPATRGYEIARRLRNEAGGSAAIIVAIATSATPGERESSWISGLDGHLALPIEIGRLLAIIREHRAIGRGEPAQARHATARPGNAREPWRGLDVHAGLVRYGGNRELYVRLLGNLENAAAALLGDLRQAFADGAHDRVGPALHKLRGSAAVLGATDLAHAIAAIERSIAQGVAAEERLLVAGYEHALTHVSESAHALRQGAWPAQSALHLIAALRETRERLEGAVIRIESGDDRVAVEARRLHAAIAANLGDSGAAALGRAIQSLDADAILGEIDQLIRFLA